MLKKNKDLKDIMGLKDIIEKKIEKYQNDTLTTEHIEKMIRVTTSILDPKISSIFNYQIEKLGKEMIKNKKSSYDLIKVTAEIKSIIESINELFGDIMELNGAIAVHIGNEDSYLTKAQAKTMFFETLKCLIEEELDEGTTMAETNMEKLVKKLGAKDIREVMLFVKNNQEAIIEGLKALNIEPTLELVSSSLIVRFKEKYNYDIELSLEGSEKELGTIAIAYSGKLKKAILLNT